jgi:ribosomal protein S18 acetylase RimI-like enzyme
MIRPMTAADLPAIGAIQATAPEASQWQPEDYLKYRATVCCRNHQIAGFLVVHFLAPDEAEILNLVVAPALRRQGVARELLGEVEIARVFLEVRESNETARRFYEQFGFRQVAVRKGYYPTVGTGQSESGIVMELKR